MILLIDNYDSFTYNIYQYLCEIGEEVLVHRNDKITLAEISVLAPERIVISPGPGTPRAAGISNEILRTAAQHHIPILGVCLGHQCLGEVFGGVVNRAPELKHGKTSPVYHDGTGLFAEIPSPFQATRYHSLIVERESLPSCLTVTAWTENNLIMGLRHNELPLFGVQFHPESILTEHGKKLLRNFTTGLAEQHLSLAAQEKDTTASNLTDQPSAQANFT